MVKTTLTALILISIGFAAGWWITKENIQPEIVRVPFYLQEANSSGEERAVLSEPVAKRTSQIKRKRQPTMQQVVNWVKTSDNQKFINWLASWSDPTIDALKPVRRALLSKIKTTDYQSNSQLIYTYLQLDTISPVGQWLNALYLSKQGNFEGALDILFILRSYFQDEVGNSEIEILVQSIVHDWINYLSGFEQWSSLIDAYDYLIRNLGDKDELFLGKARVLHALNRQFAALQTLRNIKTIDEGSEADTINNDIVSSIRENSEAVFALQNYNQQFIIPVKINGQEIPMLIDTGASISTLNPEIAKQIRLTPTPQTINLTTAGGNVRSALKRSRSFGLAGFETERFTIAEIELGTTLPAEGLLGMDYLGQFEFFIDQTNSQFYLSRIER